FLLLIPPPPISTLFPYTTLFRSSEYRYARRVFFAPAWKEIYATDQERKQDFAEAERTCDQILEVYQECGYEVVELPRIAPGERRSEEHTSELQSQSNLVCRLLLE